MLEVKKKENILEVKLNRPEVHNAFNDELIGKITEIFTNLAADIKLVTITGLGKSFCAGADLNWMKSMVNYSEEENKQDSICLYQMFEAINNCPVPVLAKVNGHALGGGVGVVACCDYVMAQTRAKFGFTEVKLGLIPAVISSFCINKIGEAQARAWFLSGDVFDASRAYDMGLVHEVVEKDELDEKFNVLVDKFLLAGPEASRAAKALIQNIIKLDKTDLMDFSCEAIAKKRISTEGQEGMLALLEKRKANWIKNEQSTYCK